MNTIIIGIAGGTGSGESAFINKLEAFFQDDVAVLYHNNYYKAQDELEFEERKKMNYDHPDAFETELLLEQLTQLKKGEATECPAYSYIQRNRSKDVVVIEPKRVILLEGILVLTDPKLRGLLDIKIFVEADTDEKVLHRVIRDVKEWGRDIEDVVEQYLATVKPMRCLYVEPTHPTADIVANSGMNEVTFQVVWNHTEKILKDTDL